MELMIRICRLTKLAVTTNSFLINTVFFIFLSIITGPVLSYGAEESIEIRKDIRAGDVLTVDSPAFVGSSKEYAPMETVIKEGKKYHLTSSEILDIFTNEKTEYSEASILYEGVEYIDRIPETAWVQVINEDLKLEQTVELPVVSQVEERFYWDYDFTFPIKVSGYQEDTYLLGNREIPNGAPLTDYTEEFLKYLNLPEDYYEITSIVWTGEPVERNGDMVRYAHAQGKKLVKDIRAVYGGAVAVPSVQARIYRGIYEEDRIENQTDPLIYKNRETAVYERQAWNGYRKIVKYIITITITLTVLLLLLIIMLIFLKKKKAEADTEPESQSD
ncbi:hypothetical protein [Lacrimispora defluvii]|uniref:DUF3068 domain-containing protein n=1 Tax=Lacrimispora defluvii TaxID=2719233 RepID=A0ABX1VYL7_9FIRM|nr:hypothetical protein [Lacrimispora defluvii]NNJ33204.1 hypothetical protein [Lacrimispora defluvii]